ncbi:MAG: hypothetical protein BWK79_03400 [Beggiatoa sp. IS2]|nr:MAG: hypothetical protein BWK79_03400 [Beggiatoa sp. IS2]
MNNPTYRIYPQQDTDDNSVDNLAACLETQTFRIYSRIPKEVEMNATSTNTTPRLYAEETEAAADVSVYNRLDLQEVAEPIVANTTVASQLYTDEIDGSDLKKPDLQEMAEPIVANTTVVPRLHADETNETATTFKKPDLSEITDTGMTSRFYMEESTGSDLPTFKQVDSPTVQKSQEKSSTDAQPTVDVSQMKPGARLRYAREQKNLSVQYIADSLYLGTHIINAVENDDYDSLPSAVFIRGYLRNYAKLMEIPVESVIEAYDLMGQKPPPTLAPQISPKTKSQAKSSDFWVKAITSILIIGIMISMTLWSIYSSVPPPKRSEPTGDAADGRPLLLPDQPSNPTEGSVYTPPAEDESENDNGQKIPPLVVVDPKHPPAGMTTTLPLVQPDAANTPNKLILRFKQKTWIEVTDSTGKSLHKGSADKDLEITGTPPFKVRVSKESHADRVAIEYKGAKNELKSLSLTREGKFLIFAVGNTP